MQTSEIFKSLSNHEKRSIALQPYDFDQQNFGCRCPDYHTISTYFWKIDFFKMAANYQYFTPEFPIFSRFCQLSTLLRISFVMNDDRMTFYSQLHFMGSIKTLIINRNYMYTFQDGRHTKAGQYLTKQKMVYNFWKKHHTSKVLVLFFNNHV